MGEFKDAAVWKKWFFLCIMLAITHLLFGFAGTLGHLSTKSVEGIFVIGYLGIIVAVVLALGIVLTDELADNKIALICFVIFALVGGGCGFINWSSIVTYLAVKQNNDIFLKEITTCTFK